MILPAHTAILPWIDGQCGCLYQLEHHQSSHFYSLDLQVSPLAACVDLPPVCVATDRPARQRLPDPRISSVTTSQWHFVLLLRRIKMREYSNVMAFKVNMYYKINLDEDLPIPLIRRGDWRLIFNCKSNYMEQIAGDI